jgi:hypothetical protein
MPVGEMLKRMTCKEIEEWKQYFKIQNERNVSDDLASRAAAGVKRKRRTMGGK